MAKKTQKEEKTRIFVTSDLWLGRHNIIDIYKRPFSSLSDMNNTIIERWNTTVGENDIVFILGNFVYDGTRAQNLISELRGFKILMATENDKRTLQIDPKVIEELMTGADEIYNEDSMVLYEHFGLVPDNDAFEKIKEVSTEDSPEFMMLRTGIFEISQYGVVLSTYALQDWNGKDKGSINIHGGMLETPADISDETRVSARCDFWDFTPVNLHDLKKIIDMKRNGGML